LNEAGQDALIGIPAFVPTLDCHPERGMLERERAQELLLIGALITPFHPQRLQDLAL
jgi:hypothetical protein